MARAPASNEELPSIFSFDMYLNTFALTTLTLSIIHLTHGIVYLAELTLGFSYQLLRDV